MFHKYSVLVIALSLALFSEVFGIPAPVIKKDAAIFDPNPVKFDHFDLSHHTDNKQSQIQPSISIDPLHHEESSPKSVRSINSGNGVNNAVTQTPAGTALLQALTAIQTAADHSGVHLNSDPGSDQSSVMDVQAQIKKLREQVEVYQMINDMLKAETMVQKEPVFNSTPASTSSTVGGHEASLSKPDIEVTSQQPPVQLSKPRQRQNTPQKQVVPIIPQKVSGQSGQSDHDQYHHGPNGHRDYGHDNRYHNYPEYDDQGHQNDHVDYEQQYRDHRPQQHQPNYDDYYHPHENNPIQHPQVTQSPQAQIRQTRNRGQRKFKRNN